MINILEAIGNMFVTVFKLIENTLTSFITLLKYIPTYINFLNGTIALLPTIVVPFALVSISLWAIHLCIGRN